MLLISTDLKQMNKAQIHAVSGIFLSKFSQDKKKRSKTAAVFVNTLYQTPSLAVGNAQKLLEGHRHIQKNSRCLYEPIKASRV